MMTAGELTIEAVRVAADHLAFATKAGQAPTEIARSIGAPIEVAGDLARLKAAIARSWLLLKAQAVLKQSSDARNRDELRALYRAHEHFTVAMQPPRIISPLAGAPCRSAAR